MGQIPSGIRFIPKGPYYFFSLRRKSLHIRNIRGAKSDKEYNMLYQDFLALPQLKINHDVWEIAWKAAYKLRKVGVSIPITDVIISAVAMYNKCTLMHFDKHFNLLAKHIGLKAIEL